METKRIGNADICVKEYKGQRVVTFKDIDEVHGRTEGTANKRFLDNKNRFIEGEDYFIVSNSEIRKSHLFQLSDNDFTNKALITEQGYLMLVKSFTDDLAWDVQRQLVNGYFRVRNIVNSELSPNLQLMQTLLNQMIEQEKTANEAKQLAQKAVDTTNEIKEAVKPVFDNWRDEINRKFNRIQSKCNEPFDKLRTKMYIELERRAGCDLGTRLRNRKVRLAENGATKTQIENTRKLDLIEEDKRLREIFSKIVSEYEIRYCA